MPDPQFTVAAGLENNSSIFLSPLNCPNKPIPQSLHSQWSPLMLPMISGSPHVASIRIIRRISASVGTHKCSSTNFSVTLSQTLLVEKRAESPGLYRYLPGFSAFTLYANTRRAAAALSRKWMLFSYCVLMLHLYLSFLRRGLGFVLQRVKHEEMELELMKTVLL